LDPELAERHLGPAVRETLDAALLLLPVFDSLGTEHGWFLARGLSAALFLTGEDFALEDPDLHAREAIGRLRFREAVVDVRAQRVERHATLAVPLGSRHLRAAEAAGAHHLDALRASSTRLRDRLLHRAAERDALHELRRDVLGDELCVGLDLPDLDDVEEDLGVRELLEIGAQRIETRGALADDDAGLGRVDVDLRLVRSALDRHLADRGVEQLLLQELPDREVLVEEALVVLVGVPLRFPVADDPDAEPDRMDFLSHD